MGDAVVIPYLCSKQIQYLDKIKATTTLCKKGQHWVWDDVLFEILNPDDNFKGNNASCVLKISTHSHSILLSGDTEKKAEKYLISNQKKTNFLAVYSLAHIMVVKLYQVINS